MENLTADEAHQRAAAIKESVRGHLATAPADRPSTLWSGVFAIAALPASRVLASVLAFTLVAAMGGRRWGCLDD